MSNIIDLFLKTEADVGDTKEELLEHLKEAIKDSSDLKYANELIDDLCGEIYLIFEELNSKGHIIKVEVFVEQLLDLYDIYDHKDLAFIQGVILGLRAVAHFCNNDNENIFNNTRLNIEATSFKKDFINLSEKMK